MNAALPSERSSTLRWNVRPRLEAVGLTIAGVALAVAGPVLGRREALALGLFLLALVLLSALATAALTWQTGRRLREHARHLRVSGGTDARHPHPRGTTLDVRWPVDGLRGAVEVRLAPELTASMPGVATAARKDPVAAGSWAAATATPEASGAPTQVTLEPEWRGVSTVDHLRTLQPGPLGLWRGRAQVRLQPGVRVHVGPALATLPGSLARQMRAQVTASAAAIRTPRPDDVGLREHSTGDSLHRVHWAATARAGRLMVRAEEPEDHADVLIVVDLHIPAADQWPHPGGGERVSDIALEQRLSTALALAELVESTSPVSVWCTDHTGAAQVHGAGARARFGLQAFGAPGTGSPWQIDAAQAQVPTAEVIVAVAHGGDGPVPSAPRGRALAVLLDAEDPARTAWQAAGWEVLEA
ncbi:MAG: DUF58 domain-containing protein [Micrococcus sp.]|nr:DUF58 domain-containing protein [Micrococcus sp.]